MRRSSGNSHEDSNSGHWRQPGSPFDFGVEIGFGIGRSLGSSRSIGGYSLVGLRPGLAVSGEGASFRVTGILSGGIVINRSGFRLRVSAEAIRPLGGRGGGKAVHAVVRKGILPSLDLDVDRETWARGEANRVRLRLVPVERQPFRSMGFATVIVTTGLFLLGLPLVVL